MGARDWLWAVAMLGLGAFLGAFLMVLGPMVIYGLPIFLALFVLQEVFTTVVFRMPYWGLRWLWAKMKGPQHGPPPAPPPKPEPAPRGPWPTRWAFPLGMTATVVYAVVTGNHDLALLRDIPWI